MAWTTEENPRYRRGRGEYWLLYTEQEGEAMRVHSFTPEAWLSLLETGQFSYRTGDGPPHVIRPAVAQFVVGVDGMDWALQRWDARQQAVPHVRHG